MVFLVLLQSGPLYACEEDKKLPSWRMKKVKKLILITELHSIGLQGFFLWIVEVAFWGDSQFHWVTVVHQNIDDC